MKIANIIIKVVVALAAIAGAVYVVATYGDKIVAWAKKMLGSCKCCQCEEAVEEAVEAPAEEAAEEVAEEAAEETVEAPAEEAEVVATEADFEN